MTASRRVKKGAAAPIRGLARVFWSGRSQAIRLPKEFRVAEPALVIARRGKGLVLEPPDEPTDDKGWPKSFWKLFGALPDEFDVGERAAVPERKSPLDDD